MLARLVTDFLRCSKLYALVCLELRISSKNDHQSDYVMFPFSFMIYLFFFHALLIFINKNGGITCVWGPNKMSILWKLVEHEQCQFTDEEGI